MYSGELWSTSWELHISKPSFGSSVDRGFGPLSVRGCLSNLKINLENQEIPSWEGKKSDFHWFTWNRKTLFWGLGGALVWLNHWAGKEEEQHLTPTGCTKLKVTRNVSPRWKRRKKSYCDSILSFLCENCVWRLEWLVLLTGR